MEVIVKVQALQVSSLVNLPCIPNFGSTPPMQLCIKFLVSKVHQVKLWLNQRYRFTLEHVLNMTSF